MQSNPLRISGQTLQTAPALAPLMASGQFLSRTDATMEAIERYILDHQLQPGDPLPTEGTLCQDLGVSRSSVREALRQLQALEIVSVQQGRGAFVGEMTMRPLIKTILLRASIAPDSVDALRQVVQVRLTLDLGLAPEIVSAMKDTHDPELHSLVEQMIVKAENGQFFMDEDIAFHTTLVSKVGNALAEQLANAMWMVHMTALPSINPNRETLVDTAKAHEALVVSAESGDLPAYVEAVHAHYQPLVSSLTPTD